MRHLHIGFVLAIAIMLAISGQAFADPKTVDQEMDEIDITLDAVVENWATIMLGEPFFAMRESGSRAWSESYGLAAANCQWLLAVNTVVVSAFDLDQLGLVSDEDVFEQTFEEENNGPIITPAGTQSVNGKGWSGGNTTIVGHGNATCEQDIGPVFVHLDASDGFGEPAPQAVGIVEALGEMRSAYEINRGMGGGSPRIEQKITDIDYDAFAGVQNGVEIYITGHTNAASNCQLAIAWNTLILSDVDLDQFANVSDDDEETWEGPPILTFENGNGNGWYGGDTSETTTGHSHCRTTVTSITLTTDSDDGPVLPPQS